MNQVLRVMLGILAAVRLLWWLINSDGLFGWIEKLRVALGCYEYGTDGEPARAIARFVMCPYCVSFICAILVAPLAIWSTVPGDALLVCFGIAGALVLLLRWRQWQ